MGSINGWSWFCRAGLGWDMWFTSLTLRVWFGQFEPKVHLVLGLSLATLARWVVVRWTKVSKPSLDFEYLREEEEHEREKKDNLEIGQTSTTDLSDLGGLCFLHVFFFFCTLQSTSCANAKLTQHKTQQVSVVGLTAPPVSLCLQFWESSCGSCDHVINFLSCSARHDGNLGIQSRPGQSDLSEWEWIQSDWQEKRKKKQKRADWLDIFVSDGNVITYNLRHTFQ